MPEPGAGAGLVLGPGSIAELLDRARYLIFVLDADAGNITSDLIRPGALIRMSPAAVWILPGPELPAWDVVRILLEEADA